MPIGDSTGCVHAPDVNGLAFSLRGLDQLPAHARLLEAVRAADEDALDIGPGDEVKVGSVLKHIRPLILEVEAVYPMEE